MEGSKKTFFKQMKLIKNNSQNKWDADIYITMKYHSFLRKYIRHFKCNMFQTKSLIFPILNLKPAPPSSFLHLSRWQHHPTKLSGWKSWSCLWVISFSPHIRSSTKSHWLCLKTYSELEWFSPSPLLLLWSESPLFFTWFSLMAS